MIEEYELEVILNDVFDGPWIYTNKYESEKEAKLALDKIESEDNILYSRIVRITKTLIEKQEVIANKKYY